jgi:hypothetical protein
MNLVQLSKQNGGRHFCLPYRVSLYRPSILKFRSSGRLRDRPGHLKGWANRCRCAGTQLYE